METGLTDDERAIDEMFAAFFASESPIEVVRAAEALGHDPALWDRLVQTGAPGMSLPEAVGGGGAGLATSAIAVRHLGRHLAPVPLVEHIAAGRLLAVAPPDHPTLEGVASGEQIATLSLTPDSVVPAGAVADVIVSGDEKSIAITRSAPPAHAVPNGPRLPLAARTRNGETIDSQAWARAVAEWQALMATALVGLGERAIEIGVDYVKERYQFGVPVGSFQGVQHGLADAVTLVDGACLLTRRAIRSLDAGDADGETKAAMAFLFATEAARAATAASLQYHGGYGYAEEYDIQLYYRRAKGWPLQLGAPGTEYQRLAEQLLDDTAEPEPSTTDLPPEAEAFRVEVREFIAAHLTAEVIESTRDGTIHNWDFHRKLAERGWLNGAVPAELGGGGRTALEMSVLIEELQLAGAPADGMGVAIVVASVILELGNDHLRSTVARELLDGETIVSFGYSEPDSGSDVAAAQTRSVRDGDQWVINGQKMWTTMAHIADYVLLLTRTNPDLPKHRGLTMFVVPLATPGVEIQPVHTMGTERSNATFYDDVRIDDRWRIGEVDGGWTVMKSALKFERGIAGGQYYSAPLIDAAVDYARTATRPDGTRVIDDPVVRERLVRSKIDLEVCRSFALHTASLASDGVMFGVEGSMTKLFASERYKKHAGWFADIAGTDALLRAEAPDAPVGGALDEHLRGAPVTSIYGGTSEITRNLIAEARLGLPRTR